MYEFQVERMSCGGCANGIKRSVQAIDAGARVDVDLAGKKVRVETQADIDTIRSAISGAGYPVTAGAAI
ncbi:MAG: heavy-metal-associated domain-containing protein [Burkholderiaceae bacterium]